MLKRYILAKFNHHSAHTGQKKYDMDTYMYGEIQCPTMATALSNYYMKSVSAFHMYMCTQNLAEEKKARFDQKQ